MLFRAPEITLDAAIRDLGSADPRVRAAAADALGDVPEKEDRARAAQALRTVLADPRFEVRCSAALALGDLQEPSALDALVALIRDEHPAVRQAAVIALGRLGDMRAFEPLVAALREGPPDVRFQAAASLVDVDASRAFDPLAQAIRDQDAEVRGNAAAALGVLGDTRAAGWLADLLVDPKPETRLEAGLALARLGDVRATDTLLAFLGDADRAYLAIEGLEAVGDRRCAPHLAALAGRFFAAKIVRVRAAAALLAVDPDHPGATVARVFLRKAARSRRPDVRGLAEESLHKLEPHAAH
jgi:HEAT repeat protein